MDEVYSPTWSPDGSRSRSRRSPAASAIYRSWLRAAPPPAHQRTYADLQPAWSPDGRPLRSRPIGSPPIWRHSRYGGTASGWSKSQCGDRPAPSLEGLNHLDPEWGGDRSLFFVGDPGGVPNVFRLDLASAGVSRVTDVTTGRGRRDAGQSRAVGRARHRRDGVQRVPEQRLRSAPHRRAAPVEPRNRSTRRGPAAAAGQRCDRRAIEPVPPLPAIATLRARSRLRPRLSLEGIGSPYLSAGGGPLGGYVSGGGSMLFGDLLGDHQLLTAAYVSSRLDESAFGAMYINRALAVELGPDPRSVAGPAGAHHRRRARSRARARRHPDPRAAAVDQPPARRVRGVSAAPIAADRIHGGMRRSRFSREQRIEQVSTRSGMVVDAEPRRWHRARRSASPRPGSRWSATRPSSARPGRWSAAATGCRSRRMSAACNTPACSPTTAST